MKIMQKLKSILLEQQEKVRSTWCECQFRLSSPPNLIWLKQLHEELLANFKPERPHHIISRLGFDLKFEADIMALDCHSFNLSQNFGAVSAAMSRTNKFFADNKSHWLDMSEKIESRNKKVRCL